jgi:hypothetical protein
MFGVRKGWLLLPRSREPRTQENSFHSCLGQGEGVVLAMVAKNEEESPPLAFGVREEQLLVIQLCLWLLLCKR